jgi:hypothetical protein
MKTSELDIPVTEERFCWQILGERISNHVARCTIHKNNFPNSDTIAECMNTKINVLGAFPVNGVLRHEAARPIVLVQGSWRELREGEVRKETAFPHEFISFFAGSCQAATNSASLLEVATAPCFLLFQATAAPLSMTTKALTYRRVSGQVAQSASAYAITSKNWLI